MHIVQIRNKTIKTIINNLSLYEETILCADLLAVVSCHDGKCHGEWCGDFYRGRFANHDVTPKSWTDY